MLEQISGALARAQISPYLYSTQTCSKMLTLENHFPNNPHPPKLKTLHDITLVNVLPLCKIKDPLPYFDLNFLASEHGRFRAFPDI